MFTKAAALVAGPVAAAFLAGAVLPLQAASNAHVGRALGHPLYGALTSLAISSITILPAIALSRAPAPTVGLAMQGPWWIWIGGVLGAVYVGSAAALTPKLGAGGFLACVMAGQIIVAMLADHFGWMGLTPRPADLARIAGLALILIGVGLLQGLIPLRAATA